MNSDGIVRSLSASGGVCHVQSPNRQLCGLPRATLLFKRLNEYSRSPYCKNHSCIYINSSGGACREVALTSYSFCKKHLQCKSYDANGRCCPELVNKEDANNYRFCAKYHTCQLDRCQEKRVQAAPGEDDLKYCPGHKCESGSCSRLRLACRQSHWCLEHTCRDEFCTAKVDEADDFCGTHAKCKHEGCGKPVHARAGEDAGPYCSTHYCRWSSCSNERVPNNGSGAMNAPAFCETHLCKTPDCKEPRVGSQSTPCTGVWAGDEADHCAKHECKHEGCAASKANNSTWCNDHQCSERNCDQGCWNDKKWCQKHVRCTDERCDRRVVRIRGDPQEYCEKHYQRLRSPSLESLSSTHSHSHNHPHTPICLHPICQFPRSAGSPFCPSHKCLDPSCTAPSLVSQRALSLATISVRGPQCGGPTCREPRCFRPSCGRADCTLSGCRKSCPLEYNTMLLPLVQKKTTAGNKMSRYCEEHACGSLGCVRETEDGLDWCGEHVCQVGTCGNEGTVRHFAKELERLLLLCQDHMDRLSKGDVVEIAKGNVMVMVQTGGAGPGGRKKSGKWVDYYAGGFGGDKSDWWNWS